MALAATWPVANYSCARGRGRALPHRAQNHRPPNYVERLARTVTARATFSGGADCFSGPAALLIEVDGALTDLHMDGHRVAFNEAFKELGMECTTWSPAVYNDLLARGDGTGEGLVAAYYTCVSWPTFLPTSEQYLFARKVHSLKRAALARMLAAGEVPLRDGAASVVDAALAAGVRVALLAGTASADDELVSESMLRQLGPERAARVALFSAGLHSSGAEEEEAEDGGDDVAGGLEAALTAAAARIKQDAAATFAAQLAAASGASGVALAPHLRRAGATAAVRPAWLVAVAATLSAPAARCLVLAANAPLMEAAAGAGMVPVAVPRRMALAATFPAARAKYEGYGPGAATWPRLASLIPAAAPANGVISKS